jgi:hypothetical protein
MYVCVCVCMCVCLYQGVSRSFRTGRLERELQRVQLSATRRSCIAILWVSLVSFSAITLCVASQRVFFVVIVVYFVIDLVQKPSYITSFISPVHPRSEMSVQYFPPSPPPRPALGRCKAPKLFFFLQNLGELYIRCWNAAYSRNVVTPWKTGKSRKDNLLVPDIRP